MKLFSATSRNRSPLGRRVRPVEPHPKWCPLRESNPYDRSRGGLSPLRLPFRQTGNVWCPRLELNQLRLSVCSSTSRSRRPLGRRAASHWSPPFASLRLRDAERNQSAPQRRLRFQRSALPTELRISVCSPISRSRRPQAGVLQATFRNPSLRYGCET